MPNYNRVILMGNLTRDPELRYTPSGQAVADFGLAVNRLGRTPEGERRESTTFVEVTAWGRNAEVLNEHMRKGRAIFLEGHLHLDQWTSQDGQRRSKLKVVLERFQFIGSRGAPVAPPAPAEAPQAPGAPPEQWTGPPPDEEGFDDVPF